jgi:transcriptional regulator with XRE-family HTH domain
LKFIQPKEGGVSEFGSTLERLAGLHGLTNRETAALLALSEQSISELVNGKREPGLGTVQKVAEVFEIDSMAAMDGIRAILHQVADQDRFERVEKKIRHRNLKAVT